MRLRSIRALTAVSFLILTAIAGLHAQPVPAAFVPPMGRAAIDPFLVQATPTAVPRIVVKFRPTLGDPIEAALPAQPMSLTAGAAMPPVVADFMARYSVHALAPVYADLVAAKKQRQITAAQLASEVRARYPQRAGRLRAAFAPPDLSYTYVIQVQGTYADFTTALAALKTDPNVEYAQEDKISSVCLTPNDPYFSSYGSWGQAYYDLWGLHKINASSAWDTSTGAGITVAVVDTGINATHPDIAANLLPGWDFVGASVFSPQPDNNPVDHFGHGTHVSGTIAAVGNNDIGVIGVAWQAKILPVKGLDDDGDGDDVTLPPAIEWAADNGADIINASWGGGGTDQPIADAISYAYNLGVVFVAAAGNADEDANAFSPASLWNVITVAASDPNDQLASFSDWGSKIDVAAPGVDILSLRAAGTTMGTPVGDNYTRADGTSMATPHVSGLAALILSKHPEYSNEDVRQAIRVSADQVGQPGFDMNFGYGRIDAAAAVAVTGALEAKIYSPASSSTAGFPVEILGNARGNGFASYTLEYGLAPSPGAQPATWTTLQTGTSPVTGTLGLFDATAVPDGTYVIRLTARNIAGQAFIDEVQIIAASVVLLSPASPPVPPAATTFKPGAAIPISGITIAAGFQNFQVDWARGISPGSGWQTTGVTLVQGGSVSVTGGPVATWDTSSASITQADYYTIRMTVTAANFTSVTTTLVYFEPDLLSASWPQWMAGAYLQSGIIPAKDAGGKTRLALESMQSNGPPWGEFWSFSPDGSSTTMANLNVGGVSEPAAGILDSSSGNEVVLTDDYVLDVFAANGTVPAATFTTTNAIVAYNQPILVDLNGDSQLEAMVVGDHFTNGTFDGSGYVFAWRSNGQQINPNFPIEIADQNETIFGQRIIAGDINGDGNNEIVVIEGTTPTTYTPSLFGSDGLRRQWNAPSLQGFPGMMAFADLDHNGKLELILSNVEDGTLHVLQPDGSERPGWPQTSQWAGTFFAVGDLNRDGHYEIVQWGPGYLNVFNSDGTPFSAAFPWKTPPGSLGTTVWGDVPVLIADINGDGYPEIITAYESDDAAQDSLAPANASSRNAFGPRERPQVQMGPVGRTAPRRLTKQLSPQGFSANSGYASPTVVAIDRKGNLVRSWTLTGGNGEIPYTPSLGITAGDFDGSGVTEIALNFSAYPPDGYLTDGTTTVLTTGAPYNPSNDWPMIYQNPRNNAVLQPAAATGTGTSSPGSACSFTSGSNGEFFNAAGGTASINIVAPWGCQWTVSNSLDWVTVTSGASYSGSATATITISANTGTSQRANQIVIAGNPFTIEQEGTAFSGLSPAGSLAQIAFGGGWDTSVTILSLASGFMGITAPTELDFFANDGSMSALPLTSPQQTFTGTMISPLFGQSINSMGQLVLDAAGPSSVLANTAWAQVRASGPIGGFGIFKMAGQEAVVPLETRNAASYLLAFDNTSPLATGLAIGNLSTAAGSVGVVLRDDTGAQIGSETISLPALGHTSFMLTDSTQGFPLTAGKRGTMEFDTPSAGQISALGLRANGAAMTTLPVLANVGTNGGTLAHIASGGGWQTIVTLVNAGTSAAQAQLSFFDEQGNPMSLPLLFPQTGATTNAAVVSQKLAAGASLLIQTQGTASQPSQVGSAQLTTAGAVSGFAIFQNSGQEAVVPLASGSPNSQFLVFDNTQNLATGVALANESGSPATIPVFLRNDSGASLGGSTISLPANGHESFMLTDQFPAAANIRGSVQFVTPASGQISALGIRATPAGAYTTVPVITQ